MGRESKPIHRMQTELQRLKHKAMKAVQINYYREPKETVIHSDVIEVERTHKANMEFKCLCCGKQWTETINSPQIIESKEIEDNLEAYYQNIINCNNLSVKP